MDNLQYVLMEEGDVVLVDNYQVCEREHIYIERWCSEREQRMRDSEQKAEGRERERGIERAEKERASRRTIGESGERSEGAERGDPWLGCPIPALSPATPPPRPLIPSTPPALL